MQGYAPGDAHISKNVGLFISILVRYPEVGTINYDPQGHALKFSFLITKPLSDGDYLAWRSRLQSSLEAYWRLQRVKGGVVEIRRSSSDHVTVLEIQRDVDTISQEEISLVIELCREQFGGTLVCDGGEQLPEEDIAAQEEMIGQCLEEFKMSRQDKNLIAFREGGRVMVFNK